MKTLIFEGEHGIQWTAQNQLDDSDFRDSLALLSHTHQQMHMKRTRVASTSASVSFDLHKRKGRGGRTPTQSYLIEKLLKMRNLSHTWSLSSMNEEDMMQT
ncbi:unnamed protein product [Schistosoma margrebowiei]|uniref:Uncharacterized protein n=1 Tax=Schistosoma margrebowiei TaxID=48269 RepID=A0A183M4K1_9TREM|nr:unnamed protein product [Schistosoma margrebowiei]